MELSAGVSGSSVGCGARGLKVKCEDRGTLGCTRLLSPGIIHVIYCVRNQLEL